MGKKQRGEGALRPSLPDAVRKCGPYLQPQLVPWSPRRKDEHSVWSHWPTLFWVQPTWISLRVQWASLWWEQLLTEHLMLGLV